MDSILCLTGCYLCPLQVVDWAESRLFFHQRLSRRLAEEDLIQEVREAAGEDLSHTAALELVKEVYTTSKGQEWKDDVAFLAWVNNPQSLEEHKQKLRAECVAKQMVAMASSSGNMKALPQGLSALLRTVSLSETKFWSMFGIESDID